MSYRFTCQECSREFDAAMPTAKTCSQRCRMAAFYRRRAERDARIAADLLAGRSGDFAALGRGVEAALARLRPTARRRPSGEA